MPPSIDVGQSATGGTLVLKINLGDPSFNINTTNITINRYTGSLSNPPTTIYTGVYTPIFIDDGESLPSYLDFSTPYFYSVTDPSGTTTVGPFTAGAQLNVFSTYMDKLLFRLFSAGMSALAVPQGFNPIRVLQDMPLSMGSEATLFPFVVMNLDLEQQEYTQIGQDVNFSETNIQIIPVIMYRKYSFSVLSHFARERDFYKDACMSVMYAAMRSVLVEIGNDLTYSIQAANSQVSDGVNMPGFFESTIYLDMEGTFNFSITTDYPLIEFIDPVITSTTYVVSGISTTFNI